MSSVSLHWLVVSAILAVTYGNSLGEEVPEGWPSFRGGVHPGVAADGNYPTNWDIKSGQHVRWRSPIPGRGHSSPVVSRDCVFVTTAYVSTESARAVKNLNSVSNAALWLMTLVMGLCLASDASSIVSDRRRWVFYWGRGLFVFSAGILFLFQFELGPEIFDYQRCPVRSWIGSHLAATLGSAMALSLTIRQRWIPRINGIVLLLTSLSIFLLIPAKDHAYRNDGPQAFVVLFSGMIPLSLAAMIFTIQAWSHRSKSAPRVFRFCVLGLLLTSILTLFVCLRRVVSAARLDQVSLDSTTDDFFSSSIVHRILIVSSIGLVLTASLYCIARRMVSSATDKRAQRFVPIKSSLVLLNMISGGGVLIGLSCLLMNLFIARSTFLQYHLPTPVWDNLSLPRALIHIGVFSGVAMLAVLIGRRMRRWIPALGCALTLITTALCPLHVVVANSVHRESNFTRAVIALSRDDGSVKWIWEGLASAGEIVHRQNSQATPTPVIWRDRIVAYFGSAGLVCLDRATGKPLWSRTDIVYHSAYGAGASPVVLEGRVIIVCDAPTNPKIVAVDVDTGQTAWGHDRSALIEDIKCISGHSHTPFVFDLHGREVVMVTGWNKLICYDIVSGEIVSKFPLVDASDRVASAAADDACIYLGNPTATIAIFKASLLDDRLDVKWTARSDSNCVSPVSDGRRVYTVSDRGIANCIDAASGRIEWRSRLAGEFRSSPIIAGRHLYIANLDGTMHLLNLDDPNREWSTIEFSEPIFATSAAVDSQIFVRTESMVYLLE